MVLISFALMTTTEAQNSFFPNDVPDGINHIIMFSDGSWIDVADISQHWSSFNCVGWIHISRDGSLPPWVSGHGVISNHPYIVSIFDAFPNNNENEEQLNGAFIDAARRFARDARRRQGRIGIDINIRMTDEELQRSDNLMRELVAGAKADPAVLDILGTCIDGLKVQLDGVTVRTYVSRGNWYPLGIWDFLRHEAWLATHIQQEDGRIVPRSEQEILTVLLYEVFGRGHGFGIAGSYFVSETLMISKPSRDAAIWDNYSGFLHRLGERIGNENVLQMLRGNQADFENWINEQIRVLNPNFNFTYEQLQIAKGGVGAILWDRNNAQAQFTASTGLNTWDTWEAFRDAWQYFYMASDTSRSPTQRNRAAQQFNNIVLQLYTITINNNFLIGYQSEEFVRMNQLPSIHEYFQPVFNLSNPQAGIHSRWVIQYNSIHNTRPPGSIFPEVPAILADLGNCP